jgi:hypothetical protein
MVEDDDDTPIRPPPRSASPEAAAFTDVQLALFELARDCGLAAERIDRVEGPDRADVLALYARRGRKLADRLLLLFEGLQHH